MSRNTQNPTYVHLVKYENEYETLVEELVNTRKKLNELKYQPITPGLFFILTIMLIFPSVLYYLYKKKQKEEYLSNKEQLENQISNLLQKIKQVTNDSRATFFSQRSTSK